MISLWGTVLTQTLNSLETQSLTHLGTQTPSKKLMRAPAKLPTPFRPPVR